MVLPKASRCCTYSVAYMSAPSASPMPRAATIGPHGVEAEHGQAEPADLADHVLGRDVDAGQQQLAGVDAPHAHLVVGAPDRHAVPAALDDEAR